MIYLLSHALDRSADRAPDQEAMRCGGDALTYGEWLRRANTLGRLLAEGGVGRGDRVGIFLDKSLDSAVAVYGIWKAGAAYVPLDPAAPAARLQFVIRDCGIRHLVTQPRKAAVVEQLAREIRFESVIGLDELEGCGRCHPWSEVSGTGAPPPEVPILEQDLAYVMYTSGSTGVPKGLMHTHYSGLSYARASGELYGVGPGDRLGNHSPLHFDMSTFEYFTGPLFGATTVIVPEAHTKLPASLSALMEAERLTIWYSVPFALVQLLLRGVLERRDLRSLRWVLFGGEPFPTGHLRELMRRWPHARFSNVYGPAEVNQCTYYHVPALDDDDDEQVPIGRIWDGSEGLVLDAEDRPVVPGEAGELVVRTPTMMRGYWGRPDLDARAFHRRRAHDHCEDVFYRTGDLVRELPDGQLRFLGRIDRQVKVRGHRVELDEIEAVLGTVPDVEGCAVYAVPDEEGSSRIEACVRVRPGGALDAPAIRAHLAGRLPPYAVPATLLTVDQFPLTTSGKVDRRALREAAIARGDAASGARAGTDARHAPGSALGGAPVAT